MKLIFTLMTMLASLAAHAAVPVKGFVRDTAGMPLEGVVVYEEGATGNGTLTDGSGAYSLSVSSADATLVFSCMGYREVSIRLNGRSSISVTMEEDSEALEEVVVVGYGVQKKGTLTGSVSSVGQKSLRQAPADNVTNLLGGKLPGLVSRQTSGVPGENGASIYIRGISTTGSSSPLILVDGVERDFSNLDASEIADITILKDAASAAVYGVKGANGVILVTTKRGDESKPTVNYNSSASFSTNAQMLTLLNGPEYVYWHNLATDLDGLAPEYSSVQAEYVKNGNDPQGVLGDTDWLSLMFKNFAFGHNHNVSVSGGNKTVRYFAGGSILNQDGLIKDVWFKRYNLRSNIDVNLTERLLLRLDVSGRIEKRHQPGVTAGSSDPTASLDNGGKEYGYKNLVFYTISARPTTRPTLPDGRYIGYMNPLLVRDQSGFQDKNTSFVQTSLTLQYDFKNIKGLQARMMAGYDFQNSHLKHLMLPYTQYTPTYGSVDEDGNIPLTENNSPHLTDGVNTLTETQSEFSRYTFLAQLSYARTFLRSEIGADLVWEQSGTAGQSFSAARQKFVITEIPDLNFGGEIKPNSVIGNHSVSGRQGLLARGNYVWDQKYILQASLRMDWSAKFAPARRLGLFPSVSAGWRISEEEFLSGARGWLDNLKLRGSWGILGNDAISDFMYVQGVGITRDADVVLGGSPAKSLYTTSIPNIDISWETTTTWNAGADLSLFHRGLSLEADVFYKVTRDILQSQAGLFPPSLGGNYPSIVNRGVVDVRGFELVVGHEGRAGAFDYKISGNVSYAANRYISTNDSENIPTYQSKLGQPIGSVLGYVAEGLFQTQEQLQSLPKTSDAVRLGDILYKDLNGDGKITLEDRTWISGPQMPEVMYGLNIDAAWKGFGLSLFFQGAARTSIMLCGTYSALGFSDGTYYTQSFKWGSNPPKYLVEGSWRPDHTDASYPRLSTASSTNNAVASSFWKRDASYLRLKSASLSYALPEKLLRPAGIAKASVSLTASNIFTLSGLVSMGIDPEAPSVNNGYYPQQRVVSLGVNLTF